MILPRELETWVYLIVRRRTIFLQVACIVLGLVTLGTLLWPPTYESIAKILVQDNRAQLLVSPGLQENSPEHPAAVANPISEEDLNSERELLTSIYLVRQVLARYPQTPVESENELRSAMNLVLTLPDSGYRLLHKTPQLQSRDQMALKIVRHLSSYVIKRSDIIEVDFTARDPGWSKDFLQHLITQYLEYHASISHDPEAEQFFQDQAGLLRTRLQSSEENLRSFEVKTGITDLGGQRQALINRLSGLQAQYDRVGADIASVQQRVGSLQTELKSTPQQINKETRSVQNLALQQMKPQVLQLESERAELLTRYQPNSARIREIDARLKAAQRIVGNEGHLEVNERSVDLNPIWVTVDSDLSQAKTNAAAWQATQTTLAQEISKLRAQLDDLVNNGVAIQRLQRQVTADESAYMSYVRKSEEARAAGALNLNKILNVSVAQPPAMPLEPMSPNITLNLVVGLVLAVLLGLGAAWWEDLQDPCLYCVEDIEQVSGLPTIAQLRHQA